MNESAERFATEMYRYCLKEKERKIWKVNSEIRAVTVGIKVYVCLILLLKDADLNGYNAAIGEPLSSDCYF